MQTAVYRIELNDGREFRVFTGNKKQDDRLFKTFTSAKEFDNVKVTVITNGIHTVKQWEEIAKTLNK